MRTICTIEARMRSSRLPGKVLKPVLGKPMLQLMVERVQRARTIDGIVVATTELSLDDPIVELANRLNLGVFRGSEEDVLARVLGAAQAYGADVIAETTADAPLIDPALLDKIVSDFHLGGADFVANFPERTTPLGTEVRVFTTALLSELDRTTHDPADREHVSLHFWEHPEKYRLRNVRTELPSWAATLRLTVDTSEDLACITRIYEELYPKNPAFTLNDVLDLVERKPEIGEINQHIRQKVPRT
jgi:spore coat polysaccharide biosynthesis protein SpsF